MGRGTSPAGSIVDHHLIAGIFECDRQQRFFASIEIPSTQGLRDGCQGRDTPAGATDGRHHRVSAVAEVRRDLVDHLQRDDHINTLGIEQVNPSDLGQKDERRCVDDALDRHVPPPRSILRM